ncbi:MAG: SRPBCC domain-containing protein [Beijerinckiaceae bacterium]
MTARNEPSAAAEPAERVLVITRVFDAPRALVFKLWTDPSHARNWWGPRDYPATYLEMDVRLGGAWRGSLQSAETGKELRHGGVFREVAPPYRLVFTFACDEEGERGLETLVTVTFAEKDGKTLMTFRHAPFQSIAERDGHRGGWTSTFDRLADYLHGLQSREKKHV